MAYDKILQNREKITMKTYIISKQIGKKNILESFGGMQIKYRNLDSYET